MDNFYKFISNIKSGTKHNFKELISRVKDLVIFSILAIYYFTESLILTFTPAFLRKEKCLKDRVVLITGGAGGIGREMVLRLAKQGAKVIVWDQKESAIESLKKETVSKGYEVIFHNLDITDRKMVYKHADLVKDISSVEILINNAGIVCGQTLLDLPDDMIEKTFQVNIISHYWTTKAFLPDMIQRRKGHIVTVGSLTGLLGAYKCTDYSATKYAAVGFHESLFTELQTHGFTNIQTTLVCPYFVNTGMFNGCNPKRMPMLEPKDVAKRIISAIRREEYFVTIPTLSRFLIPIKNFMPAKLKWEMIYRMVKGPQSMKGLKPFKSATEAA